MGSQCLIGVLFRRLSPLTIQRENLTEEESCSLWSYLNYSWVVSVMELGNKRPLQLEDLPDIPTKDQNERISRIFDKYWEEEMGKERKERSLLRALYKTHGKPFLFESGLLRLTQEMTIFLTPLLMNKLLKFIEDPLQPSWIGFGIAFSLCVSSFVYAAVEHQYYYKFFFFLSFFSFPFILLLFSNFFSSQN